MAFQRAVSLGSNPHYFVRNAAIVGRYASTEGADVDRISGLDRWGHVCVMKVVTRSVAKVKTIDQIAALEEQVFGHNALVEDAERDPLVGTGAKRPANNYASYRERVARLKLNDLGKGARKPAKSAPSYSVVREDGVKITFTKAKAYRL